MKMHITLPEAAGLLTLDITKAEFFIAPEDIILTVELPINEESLKILEVLIALGVLYSNPREALLVFSGSVQPNYFGFILEAPDGSRIHRSNAVSTSVVDWAAISTGQVEFVKLQITVFTL